MDLEIHPLLRGRFSPLQFDADHALADCDVDQLLEAARWAPSAGNSQPWAFVIARRGGPDHDALVRRLAPSARRWAPDASALVVNVAHRHIGDSGLLYSEFADYDLGQAVAHFTLQAAAMGLACRQFRAFDADGLTTDLRLAIGWEVLTMTAVGRAAGGTPPERTRRSLDDLTTAQREADAR
ncbi:nitroreductase family protein [Nocardioides sp. CER19]|uniref:nitroreductase family protein n=1 Tax=Nocardioides sp. CER19 TaxID=3038538 RepID=UPI002449BA3F|nr:nitroreductase family protein [Nocardioides sp. CER19]MDH2415500.1 nitroreductase family protein [Nocardioides sp. CER19]